MCLRGSVRGDERTRVTDSEVEGKMMVRTAASSHFQSSRGWSGTPRTPFRVSRSVDGDRENRVLGVGRGSGSRGRYILPYSDETWRFGPGSRIRRETSQQWQGVRRAEEMGR
ncbi:hypothetical protein Taro_049292 [Colocasia esculenta]|uniref:Uncharacterized protein n=1 Tax=Colocasia esculenta TaxID=4460 RepID=A0A843XAI4_COLES|nr:hypothetical protein [Colocasia esculenta]